MTIVDDPESIQESAATTFTHLYILPAPRHFMWGDLGGGHDRLHNDLLLRRLPNISEGETRQNPRAKAALGDEARVGCGASLELAGWLIN